MFNKISLLPFLFLLLISCKNDSQLLVVSDSISEKYTDNCNSENCTQVSIDYVKVEGATSVSEIINTKINDFIITSLLYDIEDEINTSEFTIEKASKHFINNYKEDKKEFPDITSTYTAEISISEAYSSAKLLCFELQGFLFTGGAHGYGSVSFLNLDPTTGKTLSIEDICKNKKEFTQFVEKKFRAEMEIPRKETINSNGFWFEEDVFYLPKTIGFTEEEVIILYNPYEIASYAAGAIELRISLNEAQDYLNIN
jgi:hypothetical protein